MSLDLETRLRTFFASSPQTVHAIATLEISHSAMARSFDLWREAYAGSTFVDDVEHVMAPCNIEAKLAGSPGHLDQVYQIRLDTTDIEDTFREQLDLIPIDTAEKIRIVYREFLSDDLTAPQASDVLQAEGVSWTKGAAQIDAVSPRLNALRTGEVYTPRDIPMLRAFL